ncbi:unnamed protein product [Hydatigera taeniaeformis]|uniref:DUF3883 domain-containing protein n=1 Tax=Hydatigena taeniaeformis TaxID=6205 RepID=A0A0R3WZZ8_HYDTA|nr:unnamed protein product [Hydatigera taeniaeformis]
MPRSEPLPLISCCAQSPGGSSIRSIDELNAAVRNSIDLLSEIRDHIRSLGPIYNLPVALELCDVFEFHQCVKDAFVLDDEMSLFRPSMQSVMKALSSSNLTRASRNAELMMERRVKEIYQKFADDVLTDHAVAEIRRQKPKTALRKLARNCRNLHRNLESWAEENSLTWLPHYLDSLHSLADFLDDFARKGPLRSILHLVLTYCDSKAFNPRVMPPKLYEGVVRNVDSDAPDPPLIDSFEEDRVEVKKVRSLVDIVNSFNDFYEAFSSTVATESVGPQVPWQSLADLERQLNVCSGKTLLAWLAEASAESFDGSKPKCLYIGGQSKSTQPQAQQSTEAVSVISDDKMAEVPRICGFLRHLTYLTERSGEAVMRLVMEYLSIPRSPSALQLVQCILTDACVSSDKCRFLVHPQEWSFLTSRTESTQMPPTLFTQRSAVLCLLASCPVLEDPDKWSLWSFCPNSLASYWGPFDEFLSDVTADAEVCEKYNMAVVKVAGYGYVRLSVNGSLGDLDANLSKCASTVSAEVEYIASRELCDLLIGSTLCVNHFISPTECINVIGAKLRSIPLQDVWNHLIRRIILTTPLSLLSVLFSKVLLPALAEIFVFLERGEGLEDLVRSATQSYEKDRIVTGIGVVGGQLGWSHWIELFKAHRLPSAEHVDYAPSCQFTKSLVPSYLEPSHKTPLPSVQILSADVMEPSLHDVTEFDAHSAESSIAGEESTDCREFVENLRRTEFGLGVELDPKTSSLLRRLEGRLCRSLDHLSRELYGQQGHFILELLQNADDNLYTPNVIPSAHFILSPDALMVGNNEAVGFSPADISALCDIGLSTKIGHREDKTGRKGIGFKSVFAVSDAPEVHSNGFHVRFCRNLKSDGTFTSILAPEWIASPSCDLEKWRTVFRLPLRSVAQDSSTVAESVLTFARRLLTHHLLLFLRRIDCIDLPINLDLQLERKSRLILALDGPSPSFLKLLTITEMCNGRQQSSKWLLLRHSVSVAIDKLKQLFQDSSEIENIPRHTDITIAIPLSNEVPLPTFPVYAFLPVRSTEFQFLLNADFDLTSSREDVDGSSVWNQYLVNQVPTVFESLINCVIKMSTSDLIPLSQCEILGRILECLPIKKCTSASSMGIFACLEEKIRKKLSNIPWFPVLSDVKFSLPNKVLLTSPNSSQIDDPVSPEKHLFRLLIDRLGMYELDRTFLVPPQAATNNEEVEVKATISLERRTEKLFCLGARSISADIIVELISTLSTEELSRPGFLYALLTNIDFDLHSSSLQQYRYTPLTDRSAWRSRCLRNLRSLRIFPLIDGRLVSLKEIDDAMANCDGLLRHRNGLMIPPKPPSSEEGRLTNFYGVALSFSALPNNLATIVGDYLQLLGRLGPLLSPSSIYPADCTSIELPRFLTASENGLGLIVAHSFLDVINHWIVSRQPDFDLQRTQESDWFIAAAQLIILADYLGEELKFRLPVVCETAKSLKLFNPSTDVAFLPPALLKHFPDADEYDIMSLCAEALGKKELGEGEDDSVLLASSSLESQGNITIEDWTCPGLENLVLPLIERATEQFGANELVRLLCGKVAELLSRNWSQSFESCMLAVAHKDSGCNRMGEYERVVLGASSWLQALRTRRWLGLTFAIDADDGSEHVTQLVAATQNHQSAIAAANFVSTPPIYASTIFSERKSATVPIPLFAPLCPLWQCLQTSEKPLAPGLLAALGVKQVLDEFTFQVIQFFHSIFITIKVCVVCCDASCFASPLQHLMEHLSKDPCNPPSSLTVETIIQVYVLALQVVGDARPDVLHRIFSSALLVPCISAHSTCKRRKKLVDDVDLDRKEEESAAYCSFCVPQVNSQCRKRHSARTHPYHLAPAHRTCWEELRLPPLDCFDVVYEVRAGVEADDDYDGYSKVPVPSMNPTSAFAPHWSSFDRRVPLCDIYGPEWKNFFCKILRVPLTSSLEEVLSQRPFPPSAPPDTNPSKWRSAQEAFGRRLAAWYSVINRCFVAHSSTTSIATEEGDSFVAAIYNFPLLYDMTGTWRVPNQVFSSSTSSTGAELLFAWSAADLASMLPRNCLLGHSLEILRDATEHSTSGSQSVPISNSHSFLLNVLRLPVLERSVTESIGMSESQYIPGDESSLLRFAVPSPVLTRLMNDFRLLTLTWLSSANAHHHCADATAAFITTAASSDSILEAFLLPNLMLKLTLDRQNDMPSDAVKEWAFFDVVCRFWKGKLYVDKRFEADLTITDDNSSTASLFLGANNAVYNEVLTELARASFPTNHSAQVSLLQFAKGLLNLRTSLLSSSLPREEVTRQLRTYFLSHCIPRGSRHLVDLLRCIVPDASTPIPPTTPSTLFESAKSVAIGHMSLRSSSQNRQVHASVGCSTRFQTPIFEALALESDSGSSVSTPSIPSLRSSLFGCSLLRSSASLDSILPYSAHVSSSKMDIGRMGEQAVYEIYLDRMKRNHDFDFPSGHSLLGLGRLVEVRWVNGDGESRLPYDLIVFLEVHGSMPTARIELNAEVRDNLIRRSTTSPDLLLVGPIYVEVKSTGMVEEEGEGNERPELFEISLAEAAFARTSGWRYHLVRVRWSRSASSSTRLPLEPRLVHIPNLSGALTEDPANHQLYIGLRH